MRRKLLAFSLIVVLASAVSLNAEEKKKGFVGTWVPTEGQLNGEKLPEDFLKSIKLVIAADNKYSATAGEQTETGTFKVDDAKKPTTMDIVPGDGPKKGETVLAIYEMKGDTMKVCYSLEGKERPKEFTSTADNKHLVFVYKRQ